MALPTETTGFTFGWSPNDFVQNFVCYGGDARGGADKGANEGKLSILEGDVVCLYTSTFRAVQPYDGAAGTTTPMIGVALADAKLGELVPVACGPIVKCLVGTTTVTVGNKVGISEVAGEDGAIIPVTPTGGGTLTAMLGIALATGQVDDIIPVLMKGPGFCYTG